MTSSTGNFLILIATLYYFSSVEGNSGSGMMNTDDLLNPEVVVEIRFSELVSCAAVADIVEAYLNIDTSVYETKVESSMKNTVYICTGYIVRKDTMMPDNEMTTEVKKELCEPNTTALLDVLYPGKFIEITNCTEVSSSVSSSSQFFSSSSSVIISLSTTAITTSTATTTAPVSSTSSSTISSVGSTSTIGDTSTSSQTSEGSIIISSSTMVVPTESATSGSNVIALAIVIGPAAVFGFIVVLIVVILCTMCMVMGVRRRRVSKDKKNPPMWLDTKPKLGNEGVELKSENTRPLRPSRVSYASKGHLLLQTLSHPMSVEELSAALQNVDDISREYMRVPPNLVGINEIPVGAETKNRYIDVLPNPNSRVPLFLKFGVAHSDYINANYIRGHKNQPKQYIATQGPLQETIIDFWRMIWEQKVSVIIMTTGLIERKMEKCTQYWPDERGYGVTEVYGEIQVTIRKKVKKDCFTTTTFTVEHIERNVTREITHYWFTSWPDHGVPSSTAETVDFLLHTRTKREGFIMPGPTVVHCSAGIGRTGVFIAADIGMRQLEDNMTIDALKTLATMRQDKGGLIQTKEQYTFLHKVLNEYARRIGHVSNIGQFQSEEELIQNEGDDDYEEITELTTFK